MPRLILVPQFLQEQSAMLYGVLMLTLVSGGAKAQQDWAVSAPDHVEGISWEGRNRGTSFCIALLKTNRNKTKHSYEEELAVQPM